MPCLVSFQTPLESALTQKLRTKEREQQHFQQPQTMSESSLQPPNLELKKNVGIFFFFSFQNVVFSLPAAAPPMLWLTHVFCLSALAVCAAHSPAANVTATRPIMADILPTPLEVAASTLHLDERATPTCEASFQLACTAPERTWKTKGERGENEKNKTKQKKKKKKKKKREREQKEVCQTEKGSCEQSAGGEVGHALEAAAGSMGLLGLAQRALACCRTCVHCRHMISLSLSIAPQPRTNNTVQKRKKKIKKRKTKRETGIEAQRVQ